MDLPSEPLCLTQERIWDPKHLDRLSVKKNGRRSDLGRQLGPSSSSAQFTFRSLVVGLLAPFTNLVASMAHARAGRGSRGAPDLVTPLPPARAPGLRGPWGAYQRPYSLSL